MNYSKKILFNKSELVDVDILDTYFNNLQDYNFLIIDTQGYELEVLKGAEKSLNFFDYIYIEVNKEEVYENCALFSELDKFLRNHNFHCSHIRWWKIWGDALYVKNINLKS